MSLWRGRFSLLCCSVLFCFCFGFFGGASCSFEPVQVVCPQRWEAHVVAARSAVARWAGGAGYAHLVGGLSDPVAPRRQKRRQCQGARGRGQTVNANTLRQKGLGNALQCSLTVKPNKSAAAAALTPASLARLSVDVLLFLGGFAV